MEIKDKLFVAVGFKDFVHKGHTWYRRLTINHVHEALPPVLQCGTYGEPKTRSGMKHIIKKKAEVYDMYIGNDADGIRKLFQQEMVLPFHVDEIKDMIQSFRYYDLNNTPYIDRLFFYTGDDVNDQDYIGMMEIEKIRLPDLEYTGLVLKIDLLNNKIVDEPNSLI